MGSKNEPNMHMKRSSYRMEGSHGGTDKKNPVILAGGIRNLPTWLVWQSLFISLAQWFPKCASQISRDPWLVPRGSVVIICNGYFEAYLFLGVVGSFCSSVTNYIQSDLVILASIYVTPHLLRQIFFGTKYFITVNHNIILLG